MPIIRAHIGIGALTNSIHAELLLEHPSETETQPGILVRTAHQLFLVLFFIQLFFVDVFGYIELDIAGLLHSFLAGQDDGELGLR